MTKSRLILPLLILTISSGGFLSMNCGILAPWSVPAAMATNGHVRFEVDIVDRNGKPIDDVTITLVETYMRWDVVTAVAWDQKKETLQSTNLHPFSIDRSRYNTIHATFERPGFQPRRITVTRTDLVIEDEPTYTAIHYVSGETPHVQLTLFAQTANPSPAANPAAGNPPH
jgi:hypothetical protein